MNGHFTGFHQLVQKIERITPIISTLQDKQNEWSPYRVSPTGSKVRTFLFYVKAQGKAGCPNAVNKLHI